MKIDSIFSKKPWHKNKFIAKYGITLPNILLKNISLHIYNTHIFDFFIIDKIDNQYRHNNQLW